MNKIMDKNFYKRNTSTVAYDLLGKYLVRKIRGKEIALMITEVEVYDGKEDLASHASKNISKRNSTMYEEPGKWYVYLVYGLHYMLNIVTREKGYPAAILIRGVKGISGPGKITKFLNINNNFNNIVANKISNLWIEDKGVKFSKISVKKSPRIGIKYAGKIWSSKLLRFNI